MSRRIAISLLMLSMVAAAWHAPPAVAKGPAEAVGPSPKAYSELVNRSIRYLRTKGQADDGSFTSVAGPGVTALVTTSLIRSGVSIDDPLVAKSLKYLTSFVHTNGGIYAEGSLYQNYETCITMMCFIEANRDGRYTTLIKNAEAYIKRLQNDEGEGFGPDHPYYGGTGYGKHKRPDASNTGIFLDALKAAGNGEDDPAVQRALVFMRRLQKFEDEHSTLPNVVKGGQEGDEGEGSFGYATRDGGESQRKWSDDKEENARLNRERGLRGYGSMTYMGLKSLIYAGLTREDDRIKAAEGWIARNYRLDVNPGLGPNGLFYYYHTFAKTMDVLGDDYFTDADGTKHDWRRELVDVLGGHQNDDGSWINEQDRWMEGDPNLVSGYALLALSYCKPEPAAK